MRQLPILLITLYLIYSNIYSQVTLDLPVEEFQNRRQRAMKVLPDGLIIFLAKTEPKTYEQHAFLQDRNFYYFTGLSSVLSAILVLDSPKGKSYLFAPTDLNIRSLYKSLALIEISEGTETELLMDKVVDWNEFTTFIDQRLIEDPQLKLYTMKKYRPEPGPKDLDWIGDTWLHTLKTRWPNIEIEEATKATSLRLIKSPLEIEALRTVGKLTADAFMAGLPQVEPGMTVREIQGIFVKECTRKESNGIYFWPFIGSGKYSVYENIRPNFLDYTLLNHTAHSGEIVRVDIGCDFNHYKGDLGRTIPASGSYDPGQREVYNLLIAGYFAGLSLFRDGTAFSDIIKAFDNEIARHQGKMKTELGIKAIEWLLTDTAQKHLIIHDQGLGGYEGPSDTCKTNMVLVWEPKFAVENQGFYLEDMILVKPEGYEILTPGVPYTAEQIEEAMK